MRYLLVWVERFGFKGLTDGVEVSRGRSTHRDTCLGQVMTPSLPSCWGWGRAERWELMV